MQHMQAKSFKIYVILMTYKTWSLSYEANIPLDISGRRSRGSVRKRSVDRIENLYREHGLWDVVPQLADDEFHYRRLQNTELDGASWWRHQRLKPALWWHTWSQLCTSTFVCHRYGLRSGLESVYISHCYYSVWLLVISWVLIVFIKFILKMHCALHRIGRS